MQIVVISGGDFIVISVCFLLSVFGSSPTLNKQQFTAHSASTVSIHPLSNLNHGIHSCGFGPKTAPLCKLNQPGLVFSQQLHRSFYGHLSSNIKFIEL